MSVKFTLGATLPTRIQYENVQPLVEVEADSFEEARDIALKQIQSVADIVRDNKPMILNEGQPAKSATILTRLYDMAGREVYMDKKNHAYQDKDGKPYLSGSAFAHKFVRKFPKEQVSNYMASQFGVEASSILSMWETNAEASTSLGTAIHDALELYGKYRQLSKATKDGSIESALHKNPFLGAVVKAFFEDREDEDAFYEAFVSNESEHTCGFIDRLLIVDKDNKIVRVQDYKSNPDINKKKDILEPFKGKIDATELGYYWLQLSFYARILVNDGWTVQGLDIFNICARAQDDGSLKIDVDAYEHDVIDITEGLK